MTDEPMCFVLIFRWFDVLSRFPKTTSRGNNNKSRAKNGLNPFKGNNSSSSPTKGFKTDINTCQETDQEQQSSREQSQPVLWFCFATRLGLKHFSKETNAVQVDNKLQSSSPSCLPDATTNPLKNINNNLLNMNTTQGVHLSKNQDFPLKTTSCTVNQDCQEQNCINSNLGKEASSSPTSTTTCVDMKDLEKKLLHTKEELKKINKELRESYANYDHLEVRHTNYYYTVQAFEGSLPSSFSMFAFTVSPLFE